MSMTSGFVDRNEELEFLETSFDSDNFEFILLYGRRRVGKTELVKHASKNRDHVYHLVVEEEGSKQLESLVKNVSEELGGVKPDINEWEDFFQYFSSQAEGLILIIDEFPRLVEEDESMPSRFQKFIDEYLKETTNKLVLTGSSIGMMEELMSYKNPLHGRRTGQIDLTPFKFQNARKMMPEGIENQIKFYSIFGGTPYYLQQINKEKTLEQNLKDEICNSNSVLNQEPRMLIKQEFRKPGRYLSILESIASGKTTPKTISDDTDIPLQSISKYLNQLQSIRVIEHEKPVTERKKRSRNGIYTLKDNFFDFWYSKIYPNISDVVENPEQFMKTNLTEINRYYGKKFEQVCRELIIEDTEYSKVGRWWYNEDEIDVVAVNDSKEEILFGEAKWKKEPVGMKTLTELKEKANKVRWKNDQRKEEYTLFSKNGFTKELRNIEDENLRLYDLEKIDETLR